MTIKECWISIDKMRFHAYHGVMPQERVTGGEFVVSLDVKCDIAGAVLSDDVNDTVNYAEIFKIVNREMQQPSCLLEHLAGRIGKCIFSEIEGISEIRIKVQKVNPPMGGQCEGAAVSLYLINDKTF